MTKPLDVIGLAPAVRDIRNEFTRLVEPHRPDLWAYCLRLTGSPWEAEDLVQETLLRAFARLANLWQPVDIKAYLFRIASNAWIDTLRRARVPLDPIDDLVVEAQAAPPVSAAETEEAMAALLRRLPPRQRVVCLLIDTLGFSADDVAEMIGSTRGAVNGALHRGRTTLQERAGQAATSACSPAPLRHSDREVLNRFIEAFNRRDASALVALMHERASTDIVGVAEEYGRDVIRKQSLAGTLRDPTPQIAEAGTLAEEPVVYVFAIGEDGQRRLRWLVRLETADGQIRRVRDYFFTPELIRYAAARLGLPAIPFGYSFSESLETGAVDATGDA